jgi:hypothetical protein
LFGTVGRVCRRASGVEHRASASQPMRHGRWPAAGGRLARTHNLVDCALKASDLAGTAIGNEGHVKENQKAKSSWLMKLGVVAYAKAGHAAACCLACQENMEEVVGSDKTAESTNKNGPPWLRGVEGSGTHRRYGRVPRAA